MIEIDLDGQKVSVPEGSMVMHAADKAGMGFGAFSMSTRHMRQLAAIESFLW